MIHVGERQAGGMAAFSAAATGGASSRVALVTPHGTRDAISRDTGHHGGGEKAAWQEMETRDRKRRKRTIWIIVAVVLLLAVLGSVIGAVFAIRKSHKSSDGTTSTSDSGSGSDNGLTADSQQVKALMNNPDLHRVFPALDYTGLNMQYPDCLSQPPIQDNVTLDVTMMSQLAPAIRVYGTDCNQTEMVLTAIDRLNMNSTMSVWLGVWLANNATTNTRQLDQLYEILKRYPSSHFRGVIVGNEVLFRKDLSLGQLGSTMQDVKNNLTAMNIDLPVATSDLGSDWTSQLVTYTDVVMANVHPFFAGVTAQQAASWTWTFWQNNDVALTSSSSSSSTSSSTTTTTTTKRSTKSPKNIISEVGWPTQGGNDCGTGNTCASKTDGSVAGIDELNTFMEDWVCQALSNGTEYFWFEAFDEPWKIVYDTGSDGWEE